MKKRYEIEHGFLLIISGTTTLLLSRQIVKEEERRTYWSCFKSGDQQGTVRIHEGSF